MDQHEAFASLSSDKLPDRVGNLRPAVVHHVSLQLKYDQLHLVKVGDVAILEKSTSNLIIVFNHPVLLRLFALQL